MQKTRLSRRNAGVMVPLQQKADRPANDEPAIARLRMVSDAHSVEQFLVFLSPKQRQPAKQDSCYGIVFRKLSRLDAYRIESPPNGGHKV